MVQVKQRRPGLLVALLTLSPVSQVYASVFGRHLVSGATNVRGVAYRQEPAILRRSDLYPRAYNVGFSLPMESSWRYTGGGSGPNGGIDLGLFRRQDGEIEAYCNPGLHVCRALGVIGCCGNDAYCIVTSEGEGKCCPLGSACVEDPCSMTQVLCTQVLTLTPTATQSAPEPTPFTSITTTCCVRPCSYTMHLCDEKFGGFCCGNDSVCIPDKKCRSTAGPETSVSTKATFTTEQCSTGSFACAEAAGGGCCPDKMICTEINNTFGCAESGSGVKTREIFTSEKSQTGSADAIVTEPPTETPSVTGDADGASDTNTGDDDSGSNTSESDSGLSAGAKAGIGIGAGVGVLSLFAIGAFFFIRHRKKKTTDNAAQIPPPPPNQPPQDPQMSQYGGYGQQTPYYAGGTQYPQGYYPAPQSSPQIGPVTGYYDPSEAMKYSQQPQLAEAYGESLQPQPQPEASGGAVLLPNTVHRQSATELPGNVN